ncbi:5-hydroxytryptamine receptor 4 [Varanus komodoensis]|nr:5-hydroxytryptamine receptor 4 [Varanus komodoensis]
MGQLPGHGGGALRPSKCQRHPGRPPGVTRDERPTTTTVVEYLMRPSLTQALLPAAPSSAEGFGVAKIALLTFISAVILMAILGNLLVMVAVCRDRQLRKIKTNYFIVSLAFADLLVSVLVMPFGAIELVRDNWIYGRMFCLVRTSLDVLLTTASILHLCCISLDRVLGLNPEIQCQVTRGKEKEYMVGDTEAIAAELFWLPRAPESYRVVLKKASLDPEVAANYRPVVNILFLGKVLERVDETDYLDPSGARVLG